MAKRDKQGAPAPAVRFTAGVVAHNEGATGRLRTWLEHWIPLVGADGVVLILHDCSDDSAAIAEEMGVKHVDVRVSGLIEEILWETVALAPPDAWHIRLGGIDEFISAEHLSRMADVIRANPHVRLYWMARRNYCEGVDISDMMGPDWQLDLMLPQPPPIRFQGGMHSYPKILLHASNLGMMNPGVAYIEHRRTLDDVERCNRARDGFASPHMIQQQESFIQAVRERLAREGKGPKE